MRNRRAQGWDRDVPGTTSRAPNSHGGAQGTQWGQSGTAVPVLPPRCWDRRQGQPSLCPQQGPLTFPCGCSRWKPNSPSGTAAALLTAAGQLDTSLLLEAGRLDSAQPVHHIRRFSFQIPPLPFTAGPGQAQLVQHHPSACLWSNTSAGSDEECLAIHSCVRRMGSHCLCTHSKTWHRVETQPGLPTLQGIGVPVPPLGRTQDWAMGPWGCALWGWAAVPGEQRGHQAGSLRTLLPPHCRCAAAPSAGMGPVVLQSSWCCRVPCLEGGGDSDVGVSLSMWW